ncbi:fumarylacetoacetate hydrolase family protein [Rhodobacteraceae bacterium N5(2021)]|uniref:Fumarylacetoacetate hydrolase family protein n=1 Tax=Gymnodinialimonas phycosphaerae TaxID=2841589 RepID=A0A975TY79_9RHOB|nr:fumarylacetoacetate hydrolase family protein [Gymnodinialimonas phycosphaerae]MBY4892742.1 fumarylacetoacetate hydrolase family protein [Gymnodinialimonas phycosphaerae]
MAYVFDPMPTPTVPVAGMTAHFPVRRIFCVGRNYAEHAREMGHDDREPPFFFSKPSDALVGDGETIAYPPATSNLHYEAELVVALDKGGRDIAEADALSLVFGYACGNDLTRRDVQGVAKKAGRPWDMGKGFDRSAVIGPIHRVADVGHLDQGAIGLTVNGEVKQTGDLSEMIWSTPEIIAYLSGLVTLAPGDLIMTGTPAGVGALTVGDTCTVSIAGLPDLSVTIGAPA